MVEGATASKYLLSFEDDREETRAGECFHSHSVSTSKGPWRRRYLLSLWLRLRGPAGASGVNTAALKSSR